MSENGTKTSLSVLRLVIVFTALLVFALCALNQYALIDIAFMSTQAIAQLFPAIIGATYWKKTSEKGVFFGLITGLIMLIVMWLMHIEPFGFIPGFWALIVNVIIQVVFNCLVRKKERTSVHISSRIL